MGQYYVIANITKREFIDPHFFGSGVKLMEFSMDSKGAMTGLAVLLASSNGQGGGDLHLTNDDFDDIPGRWAGDRIVVAGDYDDNPNSPGCGVYTMCGETNVLEQLANAVEPTGIYTDISPRVLGCLLEDDYFKECFLSVKSDNAAWSDYIKRQRREAWAKARPNDAVPAELV